jgi:hypothetical protein
MNIISGLLSGEKRQRSDSPTPDDPLETTVLAALQKFLPSLVAQMSEKVGDTLKATIEATVVAAVEPLKTEIGQLAGRVSTIEQQFASFGDNFDSILEAKIESKVAARLGTVDETVRASYEAIDNTLTSCLLSVETLERKLRSPNAILFGVAESLGEHQLTQVKSLLGDTSINDTIRLGKPSLAAPRPRPVLIKFSSIAAKHAAFKKAKELRRQFKVSIDDDLTPGQQAARTSRASQVQALRGEGWTTFWRGDNLFKVKAGGAPLQVPVLVPAVASAAAATAAAAAPSSSPAAGPPPSTSSGAAGPSPMCA